MSTLWNVSPNQHRPKAGHLYSRMYSRLSYSASRLNLFTCSSPACTLRHSDTQSLPSSRWKAQTEPYWDVWIPLNSHQHLYWLSPSFHTTLPAWLQQPPPEGWAIRPSFIIPFPLPQVRLGLTASVGVPKRLFPVYKFTVVLTSLHSYCESRYTNGCKALDLMVC